jgi:hypothetical protein
VGCCGGSGECATPAKAEAQADTLGDAVAISVAVSDADVWVRGGGQP